MLFKKKNTRSIRSRVGHNGMLLYTPDEKQVCIAYDSTGDSYTVRNEPATLWQIKEDNYHDSYLDSYTKKEFNFLLVRLILEIFIPIVFISICNKMNILPVRSRAGIYLLLFSLGFILEYSIIKGLKRRKTEKGRRIMKWRGALNMTLNAFDKKEIPPTLEEIQKCSIYRVNTEYHLSPGEIVAIFFLFLAISCFMPTLTIQLVSIPILFGIFIFAYQTALFGVLRLTFVTTPDLYELKMARDLIDFWYLVSYKNNLQ